LNDLGHIQILLWKGSLGIIEVTDIQNKLREIKKKYKLKGENYESTN